MAREQPQEQCAMHAERPRRGGHVAALLTQRLLGACLILGRQGEPARALPD